MRWEDNDDADKEGGLEEVEIPLPFVAQLDPALLIDSIKSIRIRSGAFKAQPVIGSRSNLRDRFKFRSDSEVNTAVAGDPYSKIGQSCCPSISLPSALFCLQPG